ncbi:V(D)J recombination-activating protein 2 [Syngnathoides biaculeatus]|uniref:V(D)J recombination-activating protein 2 n=1 Tax=Syngnathoides biaculeatus TaxID=300417 RepID=UPI002ADE3FB7|nr:V(D)J recombination-activating protein 2 [Syngnathoides biaculeatus]
MTLQPLNPVNCEGLLQHGCSLLHLDGEVLLFGQKGWPKRSCPTGVFGLRLKRGELRLRAISFSNDSQYLPPLRFPSVCRLDPHDGLPESYLIHGGRTPNNDISSSLYILSMDSRGCNRKLTLRCQEKELAGEVPGARYGHTLSVVQSRGKTAFVVFGGRSYMPPKERTSENWNTVVDCPPQVFLFDLQFGCCSAYTFPDLSEGQSFHVALSREDHVYILGGHSLKSDGRPPRLFRLHVELPQGCPLLSCERLDFGLSISSAVITRTGPAHQYIMLGGYQSNSQKRMECSTVILDEKGIHIEPLEPPKWSPDIVHSGTWYGGAVGEQSMLLAVPTESRSCQTNMHYFYLVNFQKEVESKEDMQSQQGCSQDLTDYDNSTPLEDSEELYFGREPQELDDSSDGEGNSYNEKDEEDESQSGYWIKCCHACQLDLNTWEPYYSTELHRPAMIFCSKGEAGHWVHAQCMELSETLLLKLSQDNKKYFCQEHGGLPNQEMTPPRKVIPLKRTPVKVKNRKSYTAHKLSGAKKGVFRRLFD